MASSDSSRDQLGAWLLDFLSRRVKAPWERVALLPDFRARLFYIVRGFISVGLATSFLRAPGAPRLEGAVLLPVAAILVTAPNIGSTLGAIFAVLQGALFALCYNLAVISAFPATPAYAMSAVGAITFFVTCSGAPVSFKRFALASASVTLLPWGDRAGSVDVRYCLEVTASLLGGAACGLFASAIPLRFFYTATRELGARVRIVTSNLQAEVGALVLALTYELPRDCIGAGGVTPSRGSTVGFLSSEAEAPAAHLSSQHSAEPAATRTSAAFGEVPYDRASSISFTSGGNVSRTDGQPGPSRTSDGATFALVPADSPRGLTASVRMEEEAAVDREPLERSDAQDLHETFKAQYALLSPNLQVLPFEPVIVLQEIVQFVVRLVRGASADDVAAPTYRVRANIWAETALLLSHTCANMARAEAEIRSTVMHHRFMAVLRKPLCDLALATSDYMRAAVARSVRHRGALGYDCQTVWYSCGYFGEEIVSVKKFTSLRDAVEVKLQAFFAAYEIARKRVLFPTQASRTSEALARMSRVALRLRPFESDLSGSSSPTRLTLSQPSPRGAARLPPAPSFAPPSTLPAASRVLSRGDQHTTWRASEWFALNAVLFGVLHFSYAVMAAATATCSADLAPAGPLPSLAPAGGSEGDGQAADDAVSTPREEGEDDERLPSAPSEGKEQSASVPAPETRSSLRRTIDGMCSIVRTYFSARAVRRATRATVAVLVAIVAAAYWKSKFAYLAPTTCIFLSGGSEGGAFRSSSSRFVGTIIGTCIAIFIVEFAGQSPYMLSASLTFVCGLCHYARAAPSSAGVAVTAMFTACIIVMGSGGEVSSATELTIERVQQTLLGVLIFLVVGNVVFPVSARNLALWTLTSSLSLVQKSMHDTLGSLSSFVREEGRRNDNRESNRPSLPIEYPTDTTTPLLTASTTLRTYQEVLLDAASEPALWQVPFPPIGLRYAELAAGAQRASNAIRLVHQSLLALHAQAVLQEQKFGRPSESTTDLHAPLLSRSPKLSSRDLTRIISLSESPDTAIQSGHGLKSFESLMGVTERFTAHFDDVMSLIIAELERRKSSGILSWISAHCLRTCFCYCRRTGDNGASQSRSGPRSLSDTLPLRRPASTALAEAVRSISEDSITFIKECALFALILLQYAVNAHVFFRPASRFPGDKFFRSHMHRVRRSSTADGAGQPTGRLLMSNIDSIAFNTASYALQDLAEIITDMAHVVRRLEHSTSRHGVSL